MKVIKILFFLIFISLSCSPQTKPPCENGYLFSREGWLFDNGCRVIIFHGANISNYAKRAPAYTSWHTYDDYKRINTWGFNLVRLLIFWVAIEPSPGSFNDAYLEEVAERVQWAESLGINVLLDMHQDLYSEKYTGDGAPEWACLDDGVPFTEREPWNANYFEPAVISAFDNFWTNDVLQEHFIQTWEKVVERFKDNKNVIGYDLFNEPYSGSRQQEDFEKNYLKPFYDKLITRLKKIDTNHLYFYEPQIYTSGGLRSYLPLLDFDNLVYVGHYYHPLVHEGFGYSLDPTPIRAAVELRDSEAKAAEIPWLMDEFGVNPDTNNALQYINDLLNIMDEKIVGWTVWSYDKGGGFSILDSDGNERQTMDFLVRPYPQKVAGIPTKLFFDVETKGFELIFEENKNAEDPTVIFIPERHYTNGFKVEISDGNYEFNPLKQILIHHRDKDVWEHKIKIIPE